MSSRDERKLHSVHMSTGANVIYQDDRSDLLIQREHPAYIQRKAQTSSSDKPLLLPELHQPDRFDISFWANIPTQNCPRDYYNRASMDVIWNQLTQYSRLPPQPLRLSSWQSRQKKEQSQNCWRTDSTSKQHQLITAYSLLNAQHNQTPTDWISSGQHRRILLNNGQLSDGFTLVFDPQSKFKWATVAPNSPREESDQHRCKSLTSRPKSPTRKISAVR